MNIKIFYDNVNFRLKDSKKVRKLIEKVIRNEGKYPDDLIFIFTGDRKIIEINKEFLNHNWFTDVIAFDYSQDNEIKGEIYISIDTVRKNSFNYKVSLKLEVIRVIIHGTLHLCGYNDGTEMLKETMTRKEDFWLEEFRKL